MNNFFLIVATFFVFHATAQQTDLLEDFEDENSIVLSNWNGELQSQRVENPSPDAINSSAWVAKLTMIKDAEQIGGVPHIEQYYNAEDNNVITLKVWTSVEVDVAIKLENNSDWGGHNTIAKTSVTTLNQWVSVSIEFDTDDILLNKYGIFFTGSNNATGNVYYVDDLTTPATYTTNQLAFVPGNEETNVSRTTDITIYTNKGLMNSDASELTNEILQSIISLKENNSSGNSLEFNASINSEKNNITVDPDESFNFESTYFISLDETAIKYNDDTSVIAESATFTVEERVSNQMLIDFEAPETDATWTSWGSSAGFTKIDNPDKSGINISEKVGQYTVPSGDEGLENGDVNGSKLTFFDYGVTPYFRVKVWVDKPVTVGMQLQNNPDWGNNPSGVKNILVEETNQWVELVYNFSALEATQHNRVQIYFDRDKSGGSTAGDVYYFDDIHKGDTPPEGVTALIPDDGSTEISIFSTLSINGSLAYTNLDGTDITNPESHVELRENNQTGELVPTKVALSEDGLAFHIIPIEPLNPNLTYWYGIKENTTSYVGENEAINNVFVTFSTENVIVPTFVIYDEHHGDEDLTSLIELYGESGTTASLDEVIDPDDNTNFVLQYNKSEETGGWSSVHYQLDRAIDFSTGNVFSVKVKASSPCWVRFKLSSDVTDWVGTWDETDSNVFLSGEFQTLFFDFQELFAEEPDKDRSNYTHIKIFINGGDSTPATFYLDDLRGPSLEPDPNVDTDGDGVNDGDDDCPETPVGETVDSNGCSTSQSSDLDGDGVPNRYDNCPETPTGAVVDTNGCEVFTLPLDNFEVKVSSFSCMGSNDGSIYVKAKDQNYDYNVTIGDTSFSFDSSNGYNKTIDNLTVGLYEVCISVVGQNSFLQCSEVTLNQPDPLTVDSSLSLSGESVEFKLDGASSFNLVHNGTARIVPKGHITIDLFKGPNTIKLSSNLSCQGVFEKYYFNSEKILIHPNPIQNILKVIVGGNDEKAEIVVKDMRGVKLISSNKKVNSDRTIFVDMQGYSKGLYFIEVKSSTISKTSKFLKHE